MTITQEMTLKVYKEEGVGLLLSVYGYDEKLFAWVKRTVEEYVRKEREDQQIIDEAISVFGPVTFEVKS